MTTNELMRHLLVDISDDDRRHLIDVVDRNHAEQLARKRRAPRDPDALDGESAPTDYDDGDSWDDDRV